MQRRSVWLVLAFVLTTSPAWARQGDDRFHKGKLEVAGFSGLLLTRQTLEDPDFPEDNFNTSASALGADVSFYTSPRLGLGLYLSRQAMGFGPSSEHFSLSGTLVGPQIKYRIPMSGKVGLALSGAGGVASSSMTYSGSDVASFDEIDESTDGKFFMLGATLNFFMAENMSVDAGMRYQFTRVTSGTGAGQSKLNAAGFLGGAGFTLYFR